MLRRVLMFCGGLLCCAVLANAEGEGPKRRTAKPREYLQPRNDVPGLRNFAQVSPVLYRGAQPTARGFRELKKKGVKTVVNLRWLHGDRQELQGLGLRYVHIRCQAWNPRDEDVAAFLHVVRDPRNQPVFVHCQHGADRTGMMVAVYRMADQSWGKEDAAKEIHNFGFHKVWADIADYLKRFDREKLDTLMKKTLAPKVEVVPEEKGRGGKGAVQDSARQQPGATDRGRAPEASVGPPPILPARKADPRFFPAAAEQQSHGRAPSTAAPGRGGR